MNKKIFNIPLTASIHTITLRSAQEPHRPPGITSDILDAIPLETTAQWSMKINPNKINGDIFQYSQYRKTMNSLMSNMQVSQYSYYRTDLRIDCYQDVFELLYKINFLLISLFAMSYKKNQGQAVAHLCMLSKEFSDVSYDNSYLEIKFYNKKFQMMDKDPAKARLEIRCLKNLKKDGLPPPEFHKVIFDLLDTLPSNFEALQEKCNSYLLKAYKNHCKNCNGIERKRDYVTEFLSSANNALTIFTRAQLRNFLVLCGVDKAKVYDRAEYIVRKTKAVFYSKQDVVKYTEKLKTVINQFFLT